MNYKNYPVSGNRSLIRVMEGLLEVFILTVLYYIFWSHGYDAPKFLSMFMGYGHLILVGIYALLTLALIAAFDGSAGGTRYTVEYAMRRGLDIVDIPV